MTCLISILKFHAKQVLSKKTLIIILSILFLSLCFIQSGISKHKDSLRHQQLFKEFEADKLDQFKSYRQYGGYGLRILYSPAPISILFSNSTILTEMMSFMDSSSRLYIYKPLKSKNIFEFNKYWYADYSGILLFFASLLALLYGYSAFSNKEYQMFLASLTRKKMLFFSVLTSQALIIAFLLVIFIAAAIIVMAINGIYIGIDLFLLSFYFKIFLTSIVFLTLGSLLGSSKSLLKGLGMAFSAWFILLFIFPAIIGVTVANMSDFIKPDYKLEMEKLKLLMDFEKQLLKKAGTYKLGEKPSEVFKKEVLSFFANEFQKMQHLEKALMAQMGKHIRLYQFISSFSPASFYFSSNNEISGGGYESLMDFYNYSIELKEAFLKYILDKEYSSPYSAVESFIKNDANVYKAKPALPNFFFLGIFCNILWITAFAIPSYYRFKKNLTELPEIEVDDMKKPFPIYIHANNKNYWDDVQEILPGYFYNFLSNEPNPSQQNKPLFDVYLNRQPWAASTENTGKHDFIYLCHPKEFPQNVMTGNFLNLQMDLMQVSKSNRNQIIENLSLAPLMNKRMGCLKNEELGRVFLSILDMKPFSYYIFDNVTRKMPLDFALDLLEKMNDLNNADGTVLFIHSGLELLSPGKLKKINILATNAWSNHVYNMANAVEINEEIQEDNGETDV